jgi:hypothetical protein
MQEVTIKPREVYPHYIEVRETQREICWSFSTKKNSIAFALFFKPLNPPDEASTAWKIASDGPSTLAEQPRTSTASIQSEPRDKRTSSLWKALNVKLLGFNEVMPVSTYPSHKQTIKAGYIVQEPGVL